MARFHFHHTNGSLFRDVEGAELASLDAAREEAIRVMVQLLPDHHRKIWGAESLCVEVTDADGLTLFTVETCIHIAPAASHYRP